MSKFQTTIPTDLSSVMASLPKGAFFNSTRLSEDRQSLVIEWEHDDWKTPYTVPVELSPAVLRGDEPMPAVVKTDGGFKKVQNEEVAPPAPRRAQRRQRTEQNENAH